MVWWLLYNRNAREREKRKRKSASTQVRNLVLLHGSWSVIHLTSETVEPPGFRVCFLTQHNQLCFNLGHSTPHIHWGGIIVREGNDLLARNPITVAIQNRTGVYSALGRETSGISQWHFLPKCCPFSTVLTLLGKVPKSKLIKITQT